MLKRLLGQNAEARAEAYLKRCGLVVVARNWHCRFGEIDLILRDGDTLVFVEVRQRSRSDFGDAAASVTPAKQKRLLAAANQYLTGLRHTPACRFDVLALDGPEQKILWLKNAFGETH